ncbi:hypothetical protein GQ53DRAFT_62728 [Thozetella sp. PMI_491]|nr:hypothetical protein GQ53DRAFT_62728 [Thozetella sp. PMI_491]
MLYAQCLEALRPRHTSSLQCNLRLQLPDRGFGSMHSRPGSHHRDGMNIRADGTSCAGRGDPAFCSSRQATGARRQETWKAMDVRPRGVRAAMRRYVDSRALGRRCCCRPHIERAREGPERESRGAKIIWSLRSWDLCGVWLGRGLRTTRRCILNRLWCHASDLMTSVPVKSRCRCIKMSRAPVEK